MTATGYEYWADRLAGKDVRANVDSPTPGFYKDRNGKDSPWQPIAVFQDGDRMVGVIGVGRYAKELTGDDLCHRWNYFNSRVISEETYRALERGEPWPDTDPVAARQQKDDRRAAFAGFNTPEAQAAFGEEAAKALPEIAAAINPDGVLVDQITEAIKGIDAYKAIESDEQTAKAQDLRSHLTALAGKLDKHRESLVRPHLDAQQAINGKLNPIIHDAKTAAETVRKAMEAWELHKREQERKAQAERDRIERENAVAARLAEEAGRPAPPPQAAPPPINTPAPVAQIRGQSGRAANVKETFDAVIEDQDKLYAAVRTDPDLTALLQKIAQRRVDAGIETPGVSKKEAVKIR